MGGDLLDEEDLVTKEGTMHQVIYPPAVQDMENVYCVFEEG